MTNGLFYLQYDVANFIFSLKYRQRKVDLNAGEKSLLFVTKLHRKFHLYAQLSYTKISYLRKNTHLRKDAVFLHFRLKGISENMIFPWNENIRKLMKYDIFSPFHKFSWHEISYFHAVSRKDVYSEVILFLIASEWCSRMIITRPNVFCIWFLRIKYHALCC